MKLEPGSEAAGRQSASASFLPPHGEAT